MTGSRRAGGRAVLRLLAIPLSIALVDAFTDARLLVSAIDKTGHGTVEIAHEALFSSWPRLRELITLQFEDLLVLRQVRRAAREWIDHKRDAAYLWPDERLDPVYAVIDRLDPDLDEDTREFLRPEHERLVAQLQDPMMAMYQRTAVADRLAAIGAKTVDALAGLLTDADPDVRAAAAHTSARIGPTSVPAAAAILAGDPDLRFAWMHFRSCETSHPLPPSTRWRQPSMTSICVCARRRWAVSVSSAVRLPNGLCSGRWTTESIDVRWRAAGQLTAFGLSAVPGLIAALTDVEPESKSAANDALVALGSVALPALIDRLTVGTTARQRQAAASVLVEIGPSAAVVLNDTPVSPDPDVEWRTVSVLGMIGNRASARRVGLALPRPMTRWCGTPQWRHCGWSGTLVPSMTSPRSSTPTTRTSAMRPARTLAALGPEVVDRLMSMLQNVRSDRASRTIVRAACRVRRPARRPAVDPPARRPECRPR